MKSKFKSKCPACGEWIYEGDEIIAAGSGRWVHEFCPSTGDADYQNDPLIRKKSEPVKQSFLHGTLDKDKPKKCVSCNNISFLKKRIQTIQTDDGEKFTIKIFICDKCFYVMQYIEQ